MVVLVTLGAGLVACGGSDGGKQNESCREAVHDDYGPEAQGLTSSPSVCRGGLVEFTQQ
jgi:hypothetical protein